MRDCRCTSWGKSDEEGLEGRVGPEPVVEITQRQQHQLGGITSSVEH